ncbi:hypothetical protein LTR85_004253 [Meristemomyces frigidus]|nr:hypothetical protein LTR85_004253 [Meristemomyces frigidus]
MDNQLQPPTHLALSTPELLEQILLRLLDDLLPPIDREDPRSVRTHARASTLTHLLRCSEVNQTWRQCMLGSKQLQQALFLLPNDRTRRSWKQATNAQAAMYYSQPSSTAPLLNPIIQIAFAPYHFRYWHLSYHCAYLIITKRDLPALSSRSHTGQGRTISRMLLSQPPCTALEASIWEEKDESKEYVGRTSELRQPIVRCEEGLTIGMVHERVAEMFAEHADVAAIKLTTV